MNFLCKTYGHDFSARRGDCRTCVVCGENEAPPVIAGSAPTSAPRADSAQWAKDLR